MAIQKVAKIWMNGELVDWDEANVHVLTHALHYGSGVFEGVRAYETEQGTAIFRLSDHLRRLHRSAKVYSMEIPYGVEELSEAVKDTVRANELKSCYIRPLAYRGYGEMGLLPLRIPVDVVIAVWPWGTYLGEEGIENGVRVKISSFRRPDFNAIPPSAKATGQYLNSILAKIEVTGAGYDEAILLNNQGYVADGSGENVFIVRQGRIFTPPTSTGALEGITRDAVITLASDLGVKTEERNLVRTDLYLADEVFFTGTAAEIVPIKEIDDRRIGKPGPVTRQLQEAFFTAVRGESKKYRSWLDRV